MVRPVVNCAVENGAKFRVCADAGVKGMYDILEPCFSHF
jgi:hypothetical protein